MHVLQDEKHRVEKGTSSSGEPLVPEDEENRRTRLKNGGLEKWNGDDGERWAGQHSLDGRASGLESWQGGEIKTGGKGLEVDGVEDGLRRSGRS